MTSKGFPDRFLQLPKGGGTIYVEFKGTSYYDLAPLQAWWKEYLMNSNPHRYFLVTNDDELDRVKKMCDKFIKIGSILIEVERNLLKEDL